MAAKQIEREVNRLSLENVIGILSRLPVKSLLRFRCVCKLWCSIIDDPDFIDTHLERSRKEPAILLFLPKVLRNRCGLVFLDAWSSSEFCPIPKGLRRRVSLNESCNGLLCISGEDGSIQVMNPATRDHLFLPNSRKSHPPYSPPYHRSSSTYLGFHHVTKEYKVIRFFPTGDESTGCEVYTLGTSSWRQICNLDNYYPTFRAATVKGAMYWAATHPSKYLEKDPNVVSFNLKDERFTRISPPSFEIYKGTQYEIASDLVELQGSVCICILISPDANESERRMDIWMLNGDGSTKHEWARKCSLTFPCRVSSCPTASPVLIHKDKILMHETYYYCCEDGCDSVDGSDSGDYEGLLRYHHLKNGSREQVYCHDRRFTPFVHAESLVPLPAKEFNYSFEDTYADLIPDTSPIMQA